MINLFNFSNKWFEFCVKSIQIKYNNYKYIYDELERKEWR
jgi:hypothetical protein